MGFDQIYSQYLEALPHRHSHPLPSLSYHSLHSLLLDCPASQLSSLSHASACSVCDAAFFPVIEKELSAVSRYFNRRIQRLLRIHLASGVTKCVLRLKHKEARHRVAMIQEGQRLVNYASMATLATWRLLEEYDKVHKSSQGQRFKACLVAMRAEVRQSPWFVELIALHFNLKADGNDSLPELCPGCVCDFQSDRPTLLCKEYEALNLEIDVICPICLEMVFEPVALKCGHIFCFSCLCSTASVLAFEGFRKAFEEIRKANKNCKCPLCRKAGVFTNTILLTELNLFIKMSWKDYWKEQRKRERQKRMKEAKVYWSYGWRT